MKLLFYVLSLLLNFSLFVNANKEKINEKYYRKCSGMYSKEDYSGKVDPFISFNVKKLSELAENDPGLIVAIFDFQDFEHLGVRLPDDEYYYICDEYAIDAKLCNESSKNQFIIQDVVYDPFSNTNKSIVHPIMTFSQDFTGLHDTKYPVTKTGYYCVTAFTYSEGTNFDAVVNFRNAYGHLAAAEINKLPLYGLLGIFYVIAMALYSFAFWKHKHELLPLQKYLLAFFVFLTAESIFIWAYYDLKNEKGNTPGITVYMVFLSILTAGKVTFSFFLLLIVGLGYGIVFPKLNKTLMRRCQMFAVFNFAIATAYLIQNYLSNPESTSLLILITFIPLGITLFAFYYMILRSMTKTMIYLREQRQVVKLGMYKKLITIIYGSLFLIFMGTIVSSFVYIGTNTIEMIEQHWRTRFFYTDFWPTLVYFGVFVTLAFIWRPTSTSYMLASSQQLPTDPENVADFDLDDLQSLGEVDDSVPTATTNADDLDLDFTDDELDIQNTNTTKIDDQTPVTNDNK
ncbi:hypothetical protein Kpol_1056p15 [Vanderwaltozyma polyspora DSM 70294]|uniref:Membrane protein PTM1 n=1 Tax=Vanderwaltozyma polyspora (strain ATCC 22028 / DSM 70294 / BCRC 21397 / CBS 2163 / NBRC 10782 / NRRL Y-8283 / UCD 57-17) TaxID=436907 RepID=A7TLM2_VANPO|nr:uncharacterized protein Kpol_1056p15 [Vanderwaltozyma polyspora DSM 70294]EDO16814.1 hypothetical protein Kpol_1056p15 [Vanderwaltozyma polyspora DSM 70294]